MFRFYKKELACENSHLSVRSHLVAGANERRLYSQARKDCSPKQKKVLKAGTGKHFDVSDVIIGRANCCHVYRDSNNTQQSFCGCPFSHVMLDKHDVGLKCSVKIVTDSSSHPNSRQLIAHLTNAQNNYLQSSERLAILLNGRQEPFERQ